MISDDFYGFAVDTLVQSLSSDLNCIHLLLFCGGEGFFTHTGQVSYPLVALHPGHVCKRQPPVLHSCLYRKKAKVPAEEIIIFMSLKESPLHHPSLTQSRSFDHAE